MTNENSTSVSLDSHTTSNENVILSLYEKKIYDLQQLIEISRSLCSTLEFSKLIESILYTCMGQFRVLGAGIFVLDALDSDLFELDSNYYGIDIDPNISYKISASSPLVKALSKRNSVFTLEQLEKVLPNCSDLKILASLKPSLIVPLVHKSHLTGILFFAERIALTDDGEYSENEIEQILILSSLAAIAITNATLVERSATDMMTHLKLKYYFFNILTDKIEQAKEGAKNLSVIMFDIDFFKRFNDTYGHACGDYVLQTVAKIIESGIRGKDMAARYGGEEFTVLLNDTSKTDAMTVAERIRTKIEQFDFCYENQHVQVTISVGVSEYDAERNPVSPKELVEQADKALYISKRNGRNQVTFAEPGLIDEEKKND